MQGLGTAAIALTLAPLTACGKSGTLNFANAENYLGETTLDDFREATGIDVSLSVIANEDALFAQLKNGTAVPDVLMASNRMTERLVAARLLAPLSRARLREGLQGPLVRYGSTLISVCGVYYLFVSVHEQFFAH